MRSWRHSCRSTGKGEGVGGALLRGGEGEGGTDKWVCSSPGPGQACGRAVPTGREAPNSWGTHRHSGPDQRGK